MFNTCYRSITYNYLFHKWGTPLTFTEREPSATTNKERLERQATTSSLQLLRSLKLLSRSLAQQDPSLPFCTITYLPLQHSDPQVITKQQHSMPDARPTHIDIPASAPPAESYDDAIATSPHTPSSTRPAPSRGILKNPLRRPSYLGEGEVVAQTDEQREQVQDGEPRARQAGEQYVAVLIAT